MTAAFKTTLLLTFFLLRMHFIAFPHSLLEANVRSDRIGNEKPRVTSWLVKVKTLVSYRHVWEEASVTIAFPTSPYWPHSIFANSICNSFSFIELERLATSNRDFNELEALTSSISRTVSTNCDFIVPSRLSCSEQRIQASCGDCTCCLNFLKVDQRFDLLNLRPCGVCVIWYGEWELIWKNIQISALLPE